MNKTHLARYEWNPMTEVATFVHRKGDVEVTTQRHAPLRVNPQGYWLNLKRSLQLQGHTCRGW